MFGELTDEELERVRVRLPHPTQMRVGRTIEWVQQIGINGQTHMARFKVDMKGATSMKVRRKARD